MYFFFAAFVAKSIYSTVFHLDGWGCSKRISSKLPSSGLAASRCCHETGQVDVAARWRTDCSSCVRSMAQHPYLVRGLCAPGAPGTPDVLSMSAARRTRRMLQDRQGHHWQLDMRHATPKDTEPSEQVIWQIGRTSCAKCARSARHIECTSHT